MPVLDLIATVFMLLLHYGILQWKAVFPFAMYLVLKGVAFRDIASIMDMVIGLYILGMIAFGFHTFIVYIAAAYLIQKALFGFF